MTAPELAVEVLENRMRRAARVALSMRCECWVPDYMEFGPKCAKCKLLDALGGTDEEEDVA